MTAILLLLSACLLELLGLYAIMQHPGPAGTLIMAAGSHLAACGCLAAGVWMMAPVRYREPRNWTLVLLFVLPLFIPVVGLCGILFGLLPALKMPHAKSSMPWLQTPIPELPYRASAPDTQTPVNTGYLHDLLRHALNPDKRLTAIMATQRMSSRDAIPILKLALKDPADDVRLLAYSMLDNIESGINGRIRSLQERLQNAPAEEQANLHTSLAQNYWELAYLGLSQGSVLQYMLQSAENHIRTALEMRGTSEDWLLAGRIHITAGLLDEAEQAFDRSAQLGMSSSQLASYRAELAFLRKDYMAVSSCLEQLGQTSRNHLPFSALVKYWQC